MRRQIEAREPARIESGRGLRRERDQPTIVISRGGKTNRRPAVPRTRSTFQFTRRRAAWGAAGTVSKDRTITQPCRSTPPGEGAPTQCQSPCDVLEARDGFVGSLMQMNWYPNRVGRTVTRNRSTILSRRLPAPFRVR